MSKAKVRDIPLRDAANITKELKKIQKDMNKPVLSNTRQRTRSAKTAQKNWTVVETKGKRKATAKVVKQAYKRTDPSGSKLKAWARLVADPFNAPPAVCPVNYNPVPSFIVQDFTSTSRVTYAVPPNQSTEFGIWPGHGESAATDTMDGVAYHGNTVAINGVTFNVGPLAYATAPTGNCVGYYQTALGLGNAVTSLAVASTAPITPAVAAPFSAATGNDFHSRWKLVAAGFKMVNVTPEGTRGGYVQYVHPSSPMGYSTQAEFSRDPTFCMSEKCNDPGGLVIPMIPQPQQLAFWHTVSGGSPVTYPDNAALRVWFNNNSPGSSQYLEIEVIMHWELAGNNYAQIGSPVLHMPHLKNSVEPAISVLKNGEHSASNFSSVVDMVHGVVTSDHPAIAAARGVAVKGGMGLLNSIVSNL